MITSLVLVITSLSDLKTVIIVGSDDPVINVPDFTINYSYAKDFYM